MNWRTWLAFAGAGSAGAFAYRGDWLAAAGAVACVLIPLAWWVRGQMAATRTTMRALAELSAVAANLDSRNGVAR